MTRLKKVHGERNLYRDLNSLLYFLRSQKGGVNTFTPLDATRKEQAIKNAEELRGNQFRKRHEIPEKADSGPSPLLGPLLDPYRVAGYAPSSRLASGSNLRQRTPFLFMRWVLGHGLHKEAHIGSARSRPGW
jgi:hypothetical protein